MLSAVLNDFLAQVEQRWPDLARRQAAIRAEAEASVVERRWSPHSWAMEVRPYYAERNEMLVARLRRSRPDDADSWVEYGFDRLGRVVLVREPGFEGPYEEQVFVYGDGTDEVLDFEWVPEWARESGAEEFKLVAVEEHRRDGTGRMVRWARVVRGDRFDDAPARLTWEDYEYRPDGALGRVLVRRDQFAYDDAGDLVSVRQVPAFAN
jgi:hypothetical protein